MKTVTNYCKLIVEVNKIWTEMQQVEQKIMVSQSKL